MQFFSFHSAASRISTIRIPFSLSLNPKMGTPVFSCLRPFFCFFHFFSTAQPYIRAGQPRSGLPLNLNVRPYSSTLADLSCRFPNDSAHSEQRIPIALFHGPSQAQNSGFFRRSLLRRCNSFLRCNRPVLFGGSCQALAAGLTLRSSRPLTACRCCSSASSLPPSKAAQLKR